jgi:hypothetical protein
MKISASSVHPNADIDNAMRSIEDTVQLTNKESSYGIVVIFNLLRRSLGIDQRNLEEEERNSW